MADPIPSSSTVVTRLPARPALNLTLPKDDQGATPALQPRGWPADDQFVEPKPNRAPPTPDDLLTRLKKSLPEGVNIGAGGITYSVPVSI